MKSEEERQLESDVVETAVRLRRCVIEQGKSTKPLKAAINAYNEYSKAVQRLVDYRNANKPSSTTV